MGQKPRQLLRPGSQPTPISDDARRPTASGDDPSPTAEPGRRVGWLAVGIAIVGVLSLAVFGSPDLSAYDPADPGWGEVMFIISPFFAFAAASVVGLVLIVVAALRLIPVSAGRAAGATGIGAIGGPIVYVAVLMASTSVIASTLGMASAFGITSAAMSDGNLPPQFLGFMTFELPVIVGIGVTLFAALRTPRSRRAWPVERVPGRESASPRPPSSAQPFEVEPTPIRDDRTWLPSDAGGQAGSSAWVAVAVVILLVLPVFFVVFLLPSALLSLLGVTSFGVPEPVLMAIAMVWFGVSIWIAMSILTWVYRRLRQVIARIDDAMSRRRAARAARTPKPAAKIRHDVELPASLGESSGPDEELVAEAQRWRRQQGGTTRPAPRH